MFRIVVGKRFHGATTLHEKEENERCQKALRDFLKLSSEFVIADKVPFLRWFDFGGSEKATKQTAKVLDGALQGWLEEHKQKRSSSTASGSVKDGEHDFMHTMISILDDTTKEFQPSTSPSSDTINKATCPVRMRPNL